MRKILPLILFAFLVGCTTHIPTFASNDSITANTEYEFEGWVRIKYDDVFLSQSSPRERLLEEAKRKFSNADDVIDVIFYSRYTKDLFLGDVFQGLFAEARVISYK